MSSGSVAPPVNVNAGIARGTVLPGPPGANDPEIFYHQTFNQAFIWDDTTLRWTRMRSGQQPTFIDGPLYQAGPAVAAQNINALAAGNVVQWNNAGPFSISTEVGLINATQFQLFAGSPANFLRVKAIVAFGGPTTRYNGIMRIRRAGLIVPFSDRSSYIRNTGGQDQASLQLDYVIALAPGPVCQIEIDRESNATGAVNVVDGLLELEVFS